jgi:hypothetical protein
MGDGLQKFLCQWLDQTQLHAQQTKNIDVLSPLYIAFGDPLLKLLHLQKNDLSFTENSHY